MRLKMPKVALPAFSLRKKQNVAVGIEVDFDFCRVSLLQRDGDSIVLPVMPFEFEVLEDEEQSGLILKEEITRRGLNIKYANFSVPISATLFKNIKLPKASDKELKEAVEWHIKEDVENIKASTVYDYSILSEEDGFLNIVAVITKSDVVNRIIQIAENAGIEPDVIDSVGTSLINLALLQKEKVESHRDEKNICLIHLDRNDSFMLFSKDNIVLQPLDFDIKRYEILSPDDKEQEVARLINEINYFFLTISEPRIIYTSGFFVKFPEIKAYMQLRFGSRFILEDIDPVVALDVNYSGTFPLQVYNASLFMAYRGIVG